MDKAKDGGPAFPNEGGDVSGLHPHPGMSLRDYFAAVVLHASIRNQGLHYHATTDEGNECRRGTCDRAYRMADDMLKAREVAHG